MGNADTDLAIHAASPVEFEGIESHSGSAKHVVNRCAACDGCDGRTILWRNSIHPVGEIDGGGTRHALDDDARHAWNELGVISRQHSGLGIVAPSGGVPDIDRDRLAGEKIGVLVGRGNARRNRDED